MPIITSGTIPTPGSLPERWIIGYCYGCHDTRWYQDRAGELGAERHANHPTLALFEGDRLPTPNGRGICIGDIGGHDGKYWWANPYTRELEPVTIEGKLDVIHLVRIHTGDGRQLVYVLRRRFPVGRYYDYEGK